MSNLFETGDVLQDAVEQLGDIADKPENTENPSELVDMNGNVVKLAPNIGTVTIRPLAKDTSNSPKMKRRVVLKSAKPKKIRLVLKINSRVIEKS